MNAADPSPPLSVELRPLDDAGTDSVRARLIAQAVDSCNVVVWATDLDGVLVLSEGGFLPAIGLSPGLVVGMNIREWPAIPWDLLREALEAGAPSASFIVRPDLPAGMPEETRSAWESPWILSFAYRRKPSGKVVGYSCVTMPLQGATTLARFSECPLGACLVEGAHGKADRRADGTHPRSPS
jgi:PAS domain-containing protein